MPVIHNETKKCEYSLSNGSIDAVAAETEKCLQSMKYEPKNITSVRLSLEEYLLRWQGKFGSDAKLVFSTGKRRGRAYLMLELKGEQFNPLETEDEQMDWSNRILTNLGLYPSYSYLHGTNRIRLELTANKNNTFFRILAAIALAVVIGTLGRLTLPAETLNSFSADYLSLLSGKFFGLLRLVAGPIIFLSVVGGIGGIEDAATIGKFGKKVLTSFALVTLFSAIICAAVLPPVFSIPLGGKAESGNQIVQILTMLLDILPDNIVDPFLTGNSMQIIVLAVACGIAIMLLRKQTYELFRIIDEINLVVQKIVKWIGALMPFLIFTVILQNIWSDTGKALVTAWQPLLLCFAVNFAIAALYIIYAAVRLRVNPITFIRKIVPSFMIGLTTASSVAAYGELNACCLKKFGVNKKAVRFSVPFGMLMCQVGCAVDLFVNSVYAIKIFSIDITLTTLLVSVFIITMLSITSPPIPGGVMACCTILYAYFGIPSEALAIAMTLNVLTDFADTAANVSLIPPIIAVSADKLGMVDRDILTERKQPADCR